MNRNLLRVIDYRMKGIADLEIYSIARELERDIRKIYEKLNFDLKRILGNQFIRSMDSVGANIAEGFGRFHYLGFY
ncbi:MAG: four helix bundle protein [Candidatus Absconditabacterales bacterium]